MEYQTKNEPITTALLLAAGLGSRLNSLTPNCPKCLTLVNGATILERLITALKQHGFKRLVVVTGHGDQFIKDALEEEKENFIIEFIHSPLYKETNNIYSLWMAREIIQEQFLLLESDLVFEPALLTEMLFPNSIAVAKMRPWFNGTCVSLKANQQLEKFHTNVTFSPNKTLYKTVNIYSISLNTWRKIIEKLDAYILKGKVNVYYEVVFAELLLEHKITFKAVSFENKCWYEIDTLHDLKKAEELFELVENNEILSSNAMVTEARKNIPSKNQRAS